MLTAEVQALVEVVGGVDAACRDRETLTTAVAYAARLRAWLDGRDVQLAGQLAAVASFPEQAIADASRGSLRDAARILERARTVETIPALRAALADGAVCGAHVDVVGQAMRRLEPHHRPALAGRAEWFVGVAARATPDELHRAVTAEARRIQIDDGMARLERQRRATRLRTWVDGEGMWCLSGRYDPETGLAVHGRLTAAVDALFAEHVPDLCPADPLERQGFLRAHALLALTEGKGAGGGRPEVVVVVDTSNADANGTPTVDWGLPVELPVEVLHRLAGRADISPVVLCRGAVLHAPGRLDLGRTTRLANRAQRRALRASYPTCAVPGCEVRFDCCQLHHVIWWELGGSTDLDNLLPLCNAHHHAVHDLGWQLSLAPDRQLTITYPDGTNETTTPPRRGPRHRPPAAPTCTGGVTYAAPPLVPLRM